MTTLRPRLLAALAAVLMLVAPRLAAAGAPPAATGEKIYLTIAYTDPIHFDRMRWAKTTGEDLILPTLKSSASEQARLAGYTGEVIVLDEKAKVPAGALELNLQWNEGTITAEVTGPGVKKYLGVVSRRPLDDHPDHLKLQRSIDSAGLPDAKRDAALRASLQLNLYLGFRYLTNYLKTAPAAK